MAQITLRQDPPLELDDWSFALPKPVDPDPLAPAATHGVDVDLLALQLGYQPAPR